MDGPRSTALWLMIVLLSLTSCVSLPPTASIDSQAPAPTESSHSPSSQQGLSGTSWQLVSLGEIGAAQPVIGESSVSLIFQSESQAGGSSSCNSYGSAYQVQDGSLSFGTIASTLRACTDDALMQQEERYLAALQNADRFELTANTLTIWYDDGQGVLNFVAALAAPIGTVPPQATASDSTLSSVTPAGSLQLSGDDDPGAIAYIQGGDIWTLALSDGSEPVRVTEGGGAVAPRWSASGDWLAFQRDEDELWAVAPDGGEPRRIEGCAATAGSWAWSPAADRLACRTTSGGLLLVEPEGSWAFELISARGQATGAGVESLAWSPDGQWLAFSQVNTDDSGDSLQRSAALRKVKVDGSDSAELLNAGSSADHSFIVAGWSPDGAQILYWVDPMFSASILADGLPLDAIPADGGASVEIGEQGVNSVLLYSDFVTPAHPGETHPSVIAAVFGGYRAVWTNKQLGIAEAPTGQVMLLTPANVAVSSPVWSPDNQTLVFASMPDEGDLVGGEAAQQGLMLRHIFAVDADGTSEPRQLTGDPAYRDERPLWWDGGRQILFARLDAQSHASLWAIPATGGNARRLVEEIDPPSSSEGSTSWFGYYGHLQWELQFDLWAPG